MRLYRTRSLASAACRAGHVRVNGAKAKPAQTVCVGDRVEALTDGGLRILVVTRIIVKRVGRSRRGHLLRGPHSPAATQGGDAHDASP